MAGLEVVVRPIVFPNIRPAPARALAPEDNPDQGIATLSGSGGRLIDLPHSISDSVSRQKKQTETKRLVDEERVYQVDANGKINKQNYVDVQRTKASRFEEGDRSSTTRPGSIFDTTKVTYGDPPKPANVETIESDKVVKLPAGATDYIYRPGG